MGEFCWWLLFVSFWFGILGDWQRFARMHSFNTLHHSSVHIDLGAIEHNCNVICKHIGNQCGLCAVVKADGYGLGAVRVAPRLGRFAQMLSVYSPDEAGELLAAGVTTPILILAPVYSIDRFHPVYRGLSSGLVHLVVHGEEHLRALQSLAGRYGARLNVQVKIDTGLHRGGCEMDDAKTLIEQILLPTRKAGLRLTGVMTHFVSAVDDEALTRLQHDRLDGILRSLSTPIRPTCLVHEANTAAMVQWDWSHRNMVRVGLAWTGTVPSGVKPLRGFQPVVSWRSRLAHVRHVEIGERVGYSGKWTATRPSMIGIVPVGYATGYPMGVGAGDGKGCAFVRVLDSQFNQVIGDAPVVGSVCMDQIAVDLTDVPLTVVGCGVELISADPSSRATLGQIAVAAGVVPHAIISKISSRVHRTYRSPVTQINTQSATQLRQYQ
jgi:alanine racemase